MKRKTVIIVVVSLLILICLAGWATITEIRIFDNLVSQKEINQLSEDKVLGNIIDRLLAHTSSEINVKVNITRAGYSCIIFEKGHYKLTITDWFAFKTFEVLLKHCKDDQPALGPPYSAQEPLLHTTLSTKSPLYEKCRTLLDSGKRSAQKKTEKEKLQETQKKLKKANRAFR